MSKSAIYTNLIVFIVIWVFSGLNDAKVNLWMEIVSIGFVFLLLLGVVETTGEDWITDISLTLIVEVLSILVFIASISIVPNTVADILQSQQLKSERIVAIQQSKPVDGRNRIERPTPLNEEKVLMCSLGCSEEKLNKLLTNVNEDISKLRSTQQTLCIDSRWFNTIVFGLANIFLLASFVRRKFTK